MKYEELGSGVVRRKERRKVGLFIDGTGLDRAARRLNKKIDLASLVKGVCSGMQPSIARYYTLIPYEDDSRQRSFLDAVSRAGLAVVVKRLPPKGVARQVSVDLEMASDIVAFACGQTKFHLASEYQPNTEPIRGSALPTAAPFIRQRAAIVQRESKEQNNQPELSQVVTEDKAQSRDLEEKRSAIVVCPSRELSYPLSLLKEFGVETTTADFGQFNAGDVLKSAAKWIDLSDSETIWRE